MAAATKRNYSFIGIHTTGRRKLITSLAMLAANAAFTAAVKADLDLTMN